MTARTSHGGRVVIGMCGLPASGKTTTAQRLHASLGGTLIRSCDVYRDLGISLPDWVARTHGLVEEVRAYEALRDAAYGRMADLLATSLAAGTAVTIVDAVHGERAKRAVVRELCQRHGVPLVLVWCRCDFDETRRRIAMRRGRAEPEHEASDLAVYHHLVRLWESPLEDMPGVPILEWDTAAPGGELPAHAIMTYATPSTARASERSSS